MERCAHTLQFTSVSGDLTTLKCLRIWIRAILVSSRAKRVPMQLRGPIPNGMKQNGSRLAFSSAVNLHKHSRDTRTGPAVPPDKQSSCSCQSVPWSTALVHSPVGVKLVRFWPVLWVVVKVVDWDMYDKALGEGEPFHSDVLRALTSDPKGRLLDISYWRFNMCINNSISSTVHCKYCSTLNLTWFCGHLPINVYWLN